MMKTYPLCVCSFAFYRILLISFLLAIQPIAVWSAIPADEWVQETENEYAHKAEIEAYKKALQAGKTPADAKKAADAAREQAKRDFESNKPLKDPQTGKNVSKISESKPTGNQGGGNNPNANNNNNTVPNTGKPASDTPSSGKPSSNNPNQNGNQNNNVPNTGKPPTGNTNPNPGGGSGNSGNQPGNNNGGNSGNNSGNNNNNSGNNSGTHHDSEENYYQSKGYTTVYYSDNQGKTLAAPLTIGVAFGLNGSSSSSNSSANSTTSTTTQTQQNFSLNNNSQPQAPKASTTTKSNQLSQINNAPSVEPTTIHIPAVLPSTSDAAPSSTPIVSTPPTTANAPRVTAPAPAPSSPSLLQSLKDQTSSLLGLKKDTDASTKPRYDGSPVPKLALSVTDSKPVIVSNEDDTPFKIYIDGKTPLVRMKNAKPIKLDGVRQENVTKDEDGSFIFRGGKRHSIVITSPGNNVITLMQADGTPIRVRVQGLNEYGDATALCRLDESQETADGEGTTITVWGVDNPLAWKKSSRFSRELVGCLMGVTVIALAWLAYIGFFTGRVSEQHSFLKLISDRIYGSFEFFRRSSYKVYTKSFTPPPRRIL